MSCCRISSLYRSLRRAMALVQLALRPPGHAHALLALAGDPHARGLLVLGVDEHDVGDVDRAFLLDHPAHGLGPLGAGDLLGALVALDDVQTLHVNLGLPGVHAQDAACLAAILAADDDDLVVATDLRSHARAPPARGRRSS